MKYQNFKTHTAGSLFEFHFYPKKDEAIISQDESFSSNQKLWENWCATEGMPKTYDKFNISGGDENTFLYMLLVWELCQGKTLLGLGSDQTDEIAKALNQAPNLVNWAYKLEHNYIFVDDYLIENSGFEEEKTGIFTIKTFQELADMLKCCSHDAWSLTNFYITAQPEAVIQKLQSHNKPHLDHLLNEKDIFIGLLIGQDQGYYDYFLINSKFDLSENLHAATNKLHRFAKDYIAGVQTIETTEEMMNLIEDGLKKYALLPPSTKFI